MNEKVRLAFYKTQKGDWFGGLITWWTGIFNRKTPPYSHVEIGFFADGKWQYYSSSSRNPDGTNGTRWVDQDTLLRNRERWDVYVVNPIREQNDMIKDCNYELGNKYDWLGIFGFATLFGQINSKQKWYCSEVCHYIFFGKWRKRVSPKRFFVEIRSYINALLCPNITGDA